MNRSRGFAPWPEIPIFPRTSSMDSADEKRHIVKHSIEDQSAHAESNENGPGSETVDDTAVYKVYKRRWLGVAIIMLLNIVSSWNWISFAPVATLTQQYFGLSSTTPVNWLSTVYLFVYCVASPLTVYCFHHHNVRTGLNIGAALTFVGTWLKFAGGKASSTLFGLVLVGQIVSGAGQPFFLNVPTHYSDKWFTSVSRVTATALMSLSNAVGAALGELINPFLAPNAYNIPDMLLYVSIITSVICVLAPFTPNSPPTPPAPSTTEQKLHLKRSLIALSKNLHYWLLFLPFSIYLGFFNAFSALLQQIMNPYGYSDNDAGIAGAILILTGLVVAGVVSPIIDRYHAFIPVTRTLVVVVAGCYLAFIWVIRPNAYAGICVLCAALGAASFSLLPLALELSVELTHPVPPEVSASIYWIGGQLLGGIFIIVMNALRDENGDPANNYTKALIFEGVVSCVAVPLVYLLKRKDGRLAKDIGARYK